MCVGCTERFNLISKNILFHLISTHSQILNSLRKPRQVYFVTFKIFYLQKQSPLAKKRLKFYPSQLVYGWNINVLLMCVPCSPLSSSVKLLSCLACIIEVHSQTYREDLVGILYKIIFPINLHLQLHKESNCKWNTITKIFVFFFSIN